MACKTKQANFKIQFQLESGIMLEKSLGLHANRQMTDYFESRAVTYQSRSEALPWSWIRAKEVAVVEALMGGVANFSVLDLGAGAGFYARLFLARGARGGGDGGGFFSRHGCNAERVWNPTSAGGRGYCVLRGTLRTNSLRRAIGVCPR